jgi:phosphatidate cytidylyltransferase
MLIKRILTAAVGIPVLVAAVLAGQQSLAVLVTAAIVLMSLEYSKITKAAGAGSFPYILIVFAAALPWITAFVGTAAMVLWFGILIVTLMSVKIFLQKEAGIARLGSTVFGVFYLGLLPSTLILAYRPEFGAVPVLMIFVAVWIADTAAYGIGRVAGRTPLAPALSPNKTIEGAAGSLLITALVFGLFVFWTDMAIAERVMFGAAMAAAGMFGDLFESALKRESGIKDSGSILPGHGGLLDRVDSLLAAAPLGYFLLMFWLG